MAGLGKLHRGIWWIDVGRLWAVSNDTRAISMSVPWGSKSLGIAFLGIPELGGIYCNVATLQLSSCDSCTVSPQPQGSSNRNRHTLLNGVRPGETEGTALRRDANLLSLRCRF
jgi:hypothetical protein